jgi:hypothetical protein
VTYKAIALICFMVSASDHECKTRFYSKTFNDFETCKVKLIHWRLYELSRTEKMVLGDCVLSHNK